MRSQEESGQFRNFFKMASEDFDYLLSVISKQISKRNRNYRESISPEQRLAIALRVLATGDSYPNLMYFLKYQNLQYAILFKSCVLL